jgi:4-hydroxybutyryl-CoA dehydratase/vinylacetyl-CoA-Delta-isomerase
VTHIRDKLVEMSFLSQSIRGPAIAAAHCASPTPSGIYLPDALLCSASKYQAIHANYEANKLINDIAGGFIITMPSEKDYKHPALHAYIDKYLKGVPNVPTEHKIRMFRFIESISASPVVCALHYGGGTMEAQKVTISGGTDFGEYKRWAEMLAGIIPEE